MNEKNSGYKKFIESRLKLVNKESEIAPFILNDIQNKYLLDDATGRDVILKARQQGFCLDPSTPILTANLKWVNIGDVEIGTEVVGVDEHTPGGRGRGRKMRTWVVEAKKEVKAKAYRLVMESGLELIATGEHRFLTMPPVGTVKTWRQVKKIKPGYYIRFITRPWEKRTMQDAWVGGVIDGEAHFRKKKSGGVELSIHQVDNALWKELASYTAKRGYAHRVDWDTRGHRADNPVGAITFNRLGEMFEIIGRTRPVRHTHKRWWEGRSMPGKRNGIAWDEIIAIEPLRGKRKMIDIQTSGKTFIANGYVSHNSSLILALFTADFLLKENQRNVIVADISDNATELLDRVKFYIKSYEDIIGASVPLKYNSKYELFNEATNSRYTIGTADNTDFGRSKTITNLHFSEAAFYLHFDKLIAGAMQAVVPVGRVIIETTANGYGYFKTFWDECKLGERNFKPLFYKASDFYPKEFLEEKKKELREMFPQEYPETDTEAFLSSGEMFFSADALKWYLDNAREDYVAQV